MPKPQSTQESEPVERSAAGLRDVLFGAIEDLRAGRIDVAQANAISKAAETIIKSVDSQIDYERLRLDSKVPANLPNMPLVPRLRDATR